MFTCFSLVLRSLGKRDIHVSRAIDEAESQSINFDGQCRVIHTLQSGTDAMFGLLMKASMWSRIGEAKDSDQSILLDKQVRSDCVTMCKSSMNGRNRFQFNNS